MEVALALRTEMATVARTTGAQCWPNSVTVNSLIGATVHSGDLNAALRLLDEDAVLALLLPVDVVPSRRSGTNLFLAIDGC